MATDKTNERQAAVDAAIESFEAPCSHAQCPACEGRAVGHGYDVGYQTGLAARPAPSDDLVDAAQRFCGDNHGQILAAIDDLPIFADLMASFAAEAVQSATDDLRRQLADMETELKYRTILLECTECGQPAFEISPIDSATGICWNEMKSYTVKPGPKTLDQLKEEPNGK